MVDNAGRTPSFVTLEAVLLAAGRSTRMGRDKALLPLESGRPLWEHQWQKLHTLPLRACWLSIRPEQTAWAPAAVPILHDREPDRGPLGGVEAGLLASRATHVAILAVDLPVVPAAWLHRLWAECQPGCGAVGQRMDEATSWTEPLAAIFPRESLPELQMFLRGSGRRAQAWVQGEIAQGRLKAIPIDPAEHAWFANWNAPGDVTAARLDEPAL